METRRRSLVKALINTVIGFSMYLMYEGLWSRIRWGRCDV